MPFNGSGLFTRSYSWASDATNGILVRSDRMDGEDNNFASGLSNVICKDGQTTTTASIPFALGVKTGDGTVSAPIYTFIVEPSTGFFRKSAGILGVATSGVDTAEFSSSGFTAGTHYVQGAATPFLSAGTANTYYQLSFQNKSAGTTASTDIVCTADTGTDTTNYVNLGINSSGYSGTLFNNALDGYLYTQSNNLVIGTVAAKDLIFAVNNTEVGRFVSGGATSSVNSIITTSNTATLTNKTFDTAGTGNVLKINGTQVTAVKGTGAILLASSQAPAITTYLSGSGTFTTPAGVTYLKIRMVGGGGGGGGSGSGGAGSGGVGGNTTFGTTLLVANGGGSGDLNGAGGAGGTASLGSGPVGLALPGGAGGGTVYSGGSINGAGSGGNSAFGGGGGSSGDSVPAAAKAGGTNTGGGGGGGSSGGAFNGSGGGAGGYVEAFITSPLASYSYAVGAAGTAGAAGTGGIVGAAGGSGLIIVEAY